MLMRQTEIRQSIVGEETLHAKQGDEGPYYSPAKKVLITASLSQGEVLRAAEV